MARPAGGVLGGQRDETGGERVGRGAARGDLAGAEPERQGRLLLLDAVERRGGGLADVSALSRVGLGVERAVVAQVAPRVAGARVAARGRGERRRGDERARHPAVARDQRAGDGPRAVVAAVVAQLRVEQDVQPVRLSGQRLEPDVDEDGRAEGVGRVGLGQPPAALGTGHRLAEVEPVEPLDHAGGVSGLAVDRHLGPGPGDHELERAQRRGAEVGEVDLGHLALAQREPDAAVACRGGAEGLLVGGRPGRLGARRSDRARARRGGGREHGEDE